jgi:hypothetical protein
LSQVCAQVRAEYRPLWIQDLRVGFTSTDQLTDFVDTFLHHASEPKHAPKLVQILWDHDSKIGFDMTSMLLLHAHSPSFQVEFIPYNVAIGMTVGDEVCSNCMMRYDLDERGMEPDSDYDECECPDYDMSHREWEEFKIDQMEYTSDIPKFVHNVNEAWLETVRQAKVTVTCTFCQMSNHAIFRILFKDPVCETTTDSQPAWNLLTRWGILNLHTKRGTHLILAHEDEQTMSIYGYSMKNTVLREVLIRKAPPKT